MNTSHKKFMAVGFTLAILLAVIAGTFASRSPDGLESTSAKFEGSKDKSQNDFDSPMQNYSLGGQDGNTRSRSTALVLGTAVVFLLVMGLFYGFALIKKQKKNLEKKNN